MVKDKSKRPYFLNDKEWYYFDEKELRYKLKEDAPIEAVKSFIKFYLEEEEKIKFLKENKILLVEKRKEEKKRFYVSEFKNVKSVVEEIIYNNLIELFSGDDQIGPELLKRGDIEGYIAHTSLCYGNNGSVVNALGNLKEFINDFAKCEEEELLKCYLILFNNVLCIANINIEFEVYLNYENEFANKIEKMKFENLLDDLVNVDQINESTYMLWSDQNNYMISAGGWNWSNSLDDMKLFIKHKILYYMIDISCFNFSNCIDIGDYGIYKLIDVLIENSDYNKKEIFEDIKKSLIEFDQDINFNEICLIIDKLSDSLNKLNVKNELYFFKGTYYPKMLVKEHGLEYNEDNLIKTFTEDIIC